MAEITFYTNPQSRGQIIRWMLEELGQPYETVILDYGTTMKAPDYLAINPMGKVPAIRHGSVVVTEAAAICAYLADAFPEARLAPPLQDPRRGPYYRWLFFAAGPGEAAVTAKALNLLAPPERSATVGYGSFEDTMTALETAVKEGPFICGDQFTAADVYVGAQIGWGMAFGTMPERPAFVAYAERVQSRPAFVRARELDQAAQQEKEAR
jgi:glutathione S-transferase